MSRKLIPLLLLFLTLESVSQNNNPASIYEGEAINSVTFQFSGLPSDTLDSRRLTETIQSTFKVYPQTHYSGFMVDYYTSKVNLLNFVEESRLDIQLAPQGGVSLVLVTNLGPELPGYLPKRVNIFKNPRSIPVIYSDARSFLTLKVSTSEMAYSNSDAWFGVPKPLLEGNPLVGTPVGKGYTGWVEGFISAGLYGITRITQRGNLHIYGGVSYMVSFSAGAELFTNQSRFYKAPEDAFVGFVGGGRSAKGHNWGYSLMYGRKQFTLGDGWLIVNTSMNGDNRAALQLNPRWAAQSLALGSFTIDRATIQIFRLEPNELPILNSHTVIQGLNLELGNRDRMLIGASFLHVPRSAFTYYLPNGSTHTRQGLQLYNLRLFGNPALNKQGLFYKAEVGFQHSPHFDMKAWAYYGELGWSFSHTYGRPSLSYRYAYFSGDNPNTKAYERWDALYTGGNGEQWVQGSNMYKIVQNSNEISHRLQLIWSPVNKTQLVTQVWAFYAPQTLNLGGNPGLSFLKSKYYGTEINLTFKYFPSSHWYFHLNTALTVPGGAILDNAPGARNWFCLMAFARYTL